MGAKKEQSELVSNRRAFYNYEILETFEAGLQLVGTEVKSLRDHHGSLQEAYIKVAERELFLINCSIPPYRFGNVHNHPETRERKLLMHKREILRLRAAVREKGLALIPLSLYLKKGRIKLKIALAKGKKAPDKRQAIAARDEKRRIEKILKQHR